MKCVFCRLVRDNTARWVAVEPLACAFTPLDPLAPGHTLVVPTAHYAHVFDMPAEVLTETVKLVQRVAEALRVAVNASGVNILNASGPGSEQSVPQLHFHVVPRWADDGISTWPTGRSQRSLAGDPTALRADGLGPWGTPQELSLRLVVGLGVFDHNGRPVGPERYHLAGRCRSRAGLQVMNDQYAMTYAHPDCVEGLVQRGRGLGAIRALRDPREAAVFVYDGILRDWRWDSTDDRALYLARLVQDLELSPTPVVDQLAGDEESCVRACDVLELLALAGSDEAREGLRTYIREGEHWILVLESVSAGWPPEWWEDLGDVARARIGAEAELPWHPEPWTRFGIEVQSRPPVPSPSLAGLRTEELVTLLADDCAEDAAKFHALRVLNNREPTEELIPLVPSLGTADGRRPLPPLRRAVERLGAAAVPAARGWAQDERPWLAELGAEVLADHPGPEALPGLVEELARQWAARTWCGPDRTARRLARFGPDAADAVPYLRRFWLRTPHSYERTAYLEALAAIDRDGLDHVYTESLWDCEERARLRAIASAPARPEVLERVAVLRDDPMETPEVRAAARARLVAPSRPEEPCQEGEHIAGPLQ